MIESKTCIDMKKTGMQLKKYAEERGYSVKQIQRYSVDAKYGWYRYDVRFALPVYNCKTGTLERYNIYKSAMLVRHADDNNKYLYDFIGIRKEMSSPLES